MYSATAYPQASLAAHPPARLTRKPPSRTRIAASRGYALAAGTRAAVATTCWMAATVVAHDLGVWSSGR